MGKYAIIGGNRVELSVAKKMEESSMPREERLYESLLRVQGRLKKIEKESEYVLIEREGLLKELASDFPSKLLKEAKQSVLFAGDFGCINEALKSEKSNKGKVVDIGKVDLEVFESPVNEYISPVSAPVSEDKEDLYGLSRDELKARCDEAGISYKNNTPDSRMIGWLEGKGTGGSHAL
jgi:hypothetical protein